jgi:hypothetical protein
MLSRRLSVVVSVPGSVLVLVLAALLAGGAVVRAELSDPVIAAFRGKIILSRGPIPEGTSAKETIARLKAAQLRELTGATSPDGAVWRFHYTAFPGKPIDGGLKVRYISGEKDHRFAAESMVLVIDPKSGVLSGDLTINENQGLERGKAYVIQFVNDKDEIVAKTSAVFK